MITGVRRAATLATILSVAMVVVGCRRQPEALASPPGPSPIAIRLDYLRHLGLDAVVKGQPVRVVSLYAEAPDYRPTGSPARDGYEGIASLDDAARAAVVYLRAYETTGDARARDEALGLLAFVVGMEQGDGEFVNFVDAQGRPNRNAPSSRKSMSYWAARSIWAMGEAVRVLGPRDSADLKTVRPVLDRAVNRMAREIEAGRLIGGSATATSEALLGLLRCNAPSLRRKSQHWRSEQPGFSFLFRWDRRGLRRGARAWIVPVRPGTRGDRARLSR